MKSDLEHREKFPNLEFMSVIELVQLLHETKKLTPEDSKFISAINQEMKFKSRRS